MCLPCCSDYSSTRFPAWSITIISLVSITFVVLNILAIRGYITAQTIGIINTAAFGTMALFALCYARCGDLYERDRSCFSAIGLVLSILGSLTSLGIFKIWGATTVAWIGIPIPTLLSIASVGALMSLTHRHWREKGYVAW